MHATALARSQALRWCPRPRYPAMRFAQSGSVSSQRLNHIRGAVFIQEDRPVIQEGSASMWGWPTASSSDKSHRRSSGATESDWGCPKAQSASDPIYIRGRTRLHDLQLPDARAKLAQTAHAILSCSLISILCKVLYFCRRKSLCALAHHATATASPRFRSTPPTPVRCRCESSAMDATDRSTTIPS